MACVVIQGLETSSVQNMLKEVCGIGLHVLNWKRGENSHIRAYVSSHPGENKDHANTLSWHWYKVQGTEEIQSKISSVTATLGSVSWPETVPCSHAEAPVIKGIIFSHLLSRPRVCSTRRAFILWCPGQFWVGLCPACAEGRLSPRISCWGGWRLWSAVGLSSFRKGGLAGNPCQVQELLHPCASSWTCCGRGTAEGTIGSERPGNHSKELQGCGSCRLGDTIVKSERGQPYLQGGWRNSPEARQNSSGFAATEVVTELTNIKPGSKYLPERM